MEKIDVNVRIWLSLKKVGGKNFVNDKKNLLDIDTSFATCL